MACRIRPEVQNPTAAGGVVSPPRTRRPFLPGPLKGQFAKTQPVAQRRYAEFVAQGRNLPSARPELKGQMLLGSEAFVDKMRPLLEGKGELKEIPRAQRWAHRPGLKSLFSARVRQDKPARDAAMRRACLEYGDTMAAVAREAGIHPYSTVNKIIKGER
jgi:putative transposase